MGAALEGALRSLLQFLISCRDMFFSLKRGVGDLSYTSFSSSSLVGTMSADTKVIEIRYDAQSAFIVNSLGKIKNLWMIVFFETLMFNVLIIFC